MTKLTDIQSLLLSHAAQSPGASLLPLPAGYTLDEERVGKVIASLLRRKLLEPDRAADAASTWRTTEDEPIGLFVTPAGLVAIGIGAQEDASSGAPADATPPTPQPPRSTKIAHVLALLSRAEGATLPEMIAETGWLPHTTRAALTGLRKKGHAIDRFTRDEVTCYRIAETH
ncbi:DUF3489 domain-containing protein [Novosphingobium sp. M1R2S20]|uniref:DUF3489 domain-containing protein n=1 Tax=Novosphingobium rhizovicinum TaxID=3228928 RepID=A0ABV3R700_9SPHN